MAKQYWDEVLFPHFLASVRGEIYGVITREQFDEECYSYACRAISAFKFPRISTEYVTFYAIRDSEDPSVLIEVEKETDGAIPHGYFINELTYAELEVILAWMKVYWCEALISNADNFEDKYTDINIKTYSPANALDKQTKLLDTYRSYARELENRYSRVTVDRRPAVGNING